MKCGLGEWDDFIAALETQCGSYEYRHAISDLVALTQMGSLEVYISAFIDLQYQVSVHNLGLDEVYFVTQFTSWA